MDSVSESKKGAAVAMPAKADSLPANKEQNQANLPFNGTVLPEFIIDQASIYHQPIVSEESLRKEKHFASDTLKGNALSTLRNVIADRIGLLVNIKEKCLFYRTIRMNQQKTDTSSLFI